MPEGTTAMASCDASGSCAKPAAPIGADGKPKRICCACPDTKRARDECYALKGEAACQELVEAHKVCLRQEGFDV